MSELGEYPQFEIRSEAERQSALALANMALPAEASPVVGQDNSLHTVRQFGWFEGDDHYSIMHSTDEAGTESLLVLSVEFTGSSGFEGVSTQRRLVLQNGRFLVTRQLDDVRNPLEDDGNALNELELLEFELGNLMPDKDDWARFTDILGRGVAAATKQARTERIRQFRWLKNLFRR